MTARLKSANISGTATQPKNKSENIHETARQKWVYVPRTAKVNKDNIPGTARLKSANIPETATPPRKKK